MDVDEVLAQIETDKVTIDVRYTTGKPGKLTKMLIKEEDTVSVGQEVAVVEEGAEGSSGGGGGKQEVSAGTGPPSKTSCCTYCACAPTSLTISHVLRRRHGLLMAAEVDCGRGGR